MRPLKAGQYLYSFPEKQEPVWTWFLPCPSLLYFGAFFFFFFSCFLLLTTPPLLPCSCFLFDGEDWDGGNSSTSISSFDRCSMTCCWFCCFCFSFGVSCYACCLFWCCCFCLCCLCYWSCFSGCSLGGCCYFGGTSFWRDEGLALEFRPLVTTSFQTSTGALTDCLHCRCRCCAWLSRHVFFRGSYGLMSLPGEYQLCCNTCFAAIPALLITSATSFIFLYRAKKPQSCLPWCLRAPHELSLVLGLKPIKTQENSPSCKH